MKTDQVEIKNSKIEGKGVFAARDFKKGEVVLRWDISRQISRDDFEKLPEAEKRYVSAVGGKYVVMQSPEKYVNHSCAANTAIKNNCDVAVRDIARGEEITGNYGEDCAAGIAMKCNCGAKNCQGEILI